MSIFYVKLWLEIGWKCDKKVEKNAKSIRFDVLLVRPRGFEPPTVRFVAEYSIQLSYEHITIRYYIYKMEKINS